MIIQNYLYKALVNNVIDGDTVDADIDVGFKLKTTLRLRLNRINTNETRGTAGEIKRLAFAAKDFTINKVNNKEVIIQTEKSDAFGRYLAEVYFIDDDGIQKNLSDELLNNGLAVPFVK